MSTLATVTTFAAGDFTFYEDCDLTIFVGGDFTFFAGGNLILAGADFILAACQALCSGSNIKNVADIKQHKVWLFFILVASKVKYKLIANTIGSVIFYIGADIKKIVNKHEVYRVQLFFILAPI